MSEFKKCAYDNFCGPKCRLLSRIKLIIFQICPILTIFYQNVTSRDPNKTNLEQSPQKYQSESYR